jgi:hypothetical protein
MIKKLLKVSAYAAFLFIVVLMLLNLIYAAGFIDFYKPELNFFNSRDDLSGGNRKDTILVMGDSFTAGNGNYPNILRNMFPEYRIINAAIPGSGIIQAQITGKKRIIQFSPKIFIYQIYTGNDLFDITYPVNWKKISLARNIYWSIANRLPVVSYINYRLGQMMAPAAGSYIKYSALTSPYREADKFSVKKYTKHDIICNIADERLISDTVLLEGKRKHDFNILVEKLDKLMNYLPQGCRKIVVVVPHMSQLNSLYLNRAVQLGATFTEPDKFLETEYPFIRQLRTRFPDIVIINPLAALRNAVKNGMEVYYINDAHLNINGQKILADVIAPYLK